ncbi:MAG: isocitrate/isopropylmalate family dehydrogenase [Gaiellaceae bacterium]
MRRTVYTVACLSRHGIGPEVMAQASRAVGAASRLHGFAVDELHVPFGADAIMRFGHPFPSSSRRAVLGADAVLVASEDGAQLETLEEELDLRASIVRVRFDRSAELSVVAPLRADAWDWTLERSFDLARESRARISLVDVDNGRAAALEARHDGLDVERLRTAEAVRALVFAPHRFDVLVVSPELATTAGDLAACLAQNRTAAWGRLAPGGPSVFGATHGAADDIAGQGVADPSSMLLAAALMVGEGLGERRAAATLSSAVGQVHARAKPPSTRGHADTVLAQLPLAWSNAEFHREAV